MKFSIRKKMTIGFGVLLCLTASLAVVVLYNLANMERQFSFVIEHDAPVIANARQLSKLVVDMETGQRGFVITGEDEFLEPYNNAVNSFSELMEQEKQLVSDNPPQVKLLEQIDSSISEWQQLAAEPEIAMRRKLLTASVDAEHLQQILTKGVGKGILDNIRNVTVEMEEAFRLDGNLEGLLLLKSIEKNVIDRETGERGFLITGKEEFLKPYVLGQKNLSKNLDRLRVLVKNAHDREATENEIKQLEISYTKWLGEVAEPEIALRRQVNTGIKTHKELQDQLDSRSRDTIIVEIRNTITQMSNRFTFAKNDKLEALLMTAAKSIVDQKTSQREFILSGKGEFLETFFVEREVWRNSLAALQELNKNAYNIEAMTKNVDSIQSLSSDWQRLAGEPEIAARRSMDKHPESIEDVAAMLREGTGKRILDRVRGQFSDFIEEEERLTTLRFASASAASHSTRNMTILIAVISVLFGGYVATTITQGITRPIHALKLALGLVASGDLDQNIAITSDDEIGDVTKSFNQMVGDLKQLMMEKELTGQALREASEFTSNIIGSMIDMLVVISPEGNILRVNDAACELLGYKKEELIGRPSDMLFSESESESEVMSNGISLSDIIPLKQSTLRQLINEDSISNIEKLIIRKNGETIPALMSGSVMRDDEGNVTGLVCVAQDITIRKETEDRLRLAKKAADTANKSKSDFLANMSHEIRTPMTAILGFAENLLDADLPDSEKLNCVHTIRRNGEYLLSLINDILDLSKVEAGKMTVEHAECRPCSVIAEVASLMRVRADAKGLTLGIDYIGAIPETVKTDSIRLRQVLINLIGNAIKFTKVGSVRLATRFVTNCDTPYLQFDVIDTGCGITEEQKSNLFKPFTQADTSTTRKFGGTGLGLTISKRFTELLGGDLNVAATEMGVGSTFRATIAPILLDNAKMLNNPMEATYVTDDDNLADQVSKTSLQGCRILLAEDGADNQRLISYVLKKSGADVTVEENGKLALDAALAARDDCEPFDVILMDMQMPVMDGYEATGQLRQRDYTGTIIALTAHAMDSDRQKCIDAGCDAFSTKPIDRVKLISTIKSYLIESETAMASPESSKGSA